MRLIRLLPYYYVTELTLKVGSMLNFRMWLKYGLGASALYLCFTLRPAIFNSLRPVTVGSGRVGQNFMLYHLKKISAKYISFI